MFYENCSHTCDNRTIRNLVKEAAVAAARATSAAKAAEASACQAERAAKQAQESACIAQEVYEKIRCMSDELLARNPGCGCAVDPCPPRNRCDC